MCGDSGAMAASAHLPVLKFDTGASEPNRGTDQSNCAGVSAECGFPLLDDTRQDRCRLRATAKLD